MKVGTHFRKLRLNGKYVLFEDQKKKMHKCPYFAMTQYIFLAEEIIKYGYFESSALISLQACKIIFTSLFKCPLKDKGV